MCCDHSLKENIVSYFSDFQNYFQINIKADNKRSYDLSLVAHVRTVHVATSLVSPHLDFLLSFLSWLNFVLLLLSQTRYSINKVLDAENCHLYHKVCV